MSVFCSNPKFDLKLNSIDPDDFLEADDESKPLYPDCYQLFSDDAEYIDMMDGLYECMEEILDDVISYSKVSFSAYSSIICIKFYQHVSETSD